MLPGNFITACLLIWINLALLFNKGECNNEVISVRVGRTAHLPCDVTQPDLTTSPYVIEWSRESSSIPVYIKIGRYPAKIDPHFRGRMSLKPNSATLRIERVVADDDGWYVCRVLYLDHPVSYEDIEIPLNGTWLRLTVTGLQYAAFLRYNFPSTICRYISGTGDSVLDSNVSLYWKLSYEHNQP